jgi:DnaJ-class molecular chaperone
LDAILGAEKEFVTIESLKKKVSIPRGTQPFQQIILKNEGFYIINSNERGDQIITIKITIPRILSSEESCLYQKIR